MGLFVFVLCLIWVAEASQIGNVNPACAACGIVMNALEGFLIENRTQTEIEDFLQSQCNSLFTGLPRETCDMLARITPPMISQRVVKRFTVGKICVEVGVCKDQLVTEPDFQQMTTYSVNLDLPPSQRWADLCSMPFVKSYWGHFISVLQDLLPGKGDFIEDAGRAIHAVIDKEYAQEISGCAEQLWKGNSKILYGWLTIVNIAYELSDACTSIVAQDKQGRIHHARNMDFGAGGMLTSTLRNVSAVIEFTKSGKVVASQTTFLGFVGTLSGQKSNTFAVTINTRFWGGVFPNSTKGSIIDIMKEAIYAIESFPNANLVGFLAREAITSANSFSEAVQLLSTKELIADVYYTVSGVNPGEGVVISRNRTGARNMWYLNSPNNWYVLQTNYDHWTKAPWFDDRMDVGYDAMDNMGQDNISEANLLKVLSTRPVMNIQTAYTLYAFNANSTYQSWDRYCPWPCSE